MKIILAVITILGLFSCGSINEKNKGKGFIMLPVSQDRQLGAQVAKEIDGNQKEYPLLDSIKYKDVYQYIYKVRNTILNTGKVDFKDDFSWRIRIINDDKTLNAFCTPGGYIYIYTGILKYLDSEDQFAGVLAHEIGHADMRHSVRQLQLMYGAQILQQVLLGDKAALKTITDALIGVGALAYSRSHETEADERSVLYLCPTQYNAAGGAGFFEKIQKEGGQRVPQFLSTHPNPENRIEHFHNSKITQGCRGEGSFQTEYKQMVAKLPK